MLVGNGNGSKMAHSMRNGRVYPAVGDSVPGAAKDRGSHVHRGGAGPEGWVA